MNFKILSQQEAKHTPRLVASSDHNEESSASDIKEMERKQRIFSSAAHVYPKAKSQLYLKDKF